METLNCQGLACPQPVVEVRNFLAAHPQTPELTVIVDNQAAAQNVTRFLETREFKVSVQGAGPEFQVQAQKQDPGSCETAIEKAMEKPQKTLIMIGQGHPGTRGRSIRDIADAEFSPDPQGNGRGLMAAGFCQ